MSVDFLKENGFPATIHIKTSKLKENAETSKFKSVITDENNNKLIEFEHSDLRARIHWVNGYFFALRKNNQENIIILNGN